MFIVGTDPGKWGAIVALDGDGEIFYTSGIPYEGSQPCPKKLAALYHEIQVRALEIDPEAHITNYIEKIYTRPEDAGSGEYVKALELVAASAAGLIGMEDGDAKEDVAYLLGKQLDLARKFYTGRSRVDGRVGVMNYAKSAGMLFMCASLGWDIVEVGPRTWHAAIRKGAPSGLKTKEKSYWLLEKYGMTDDPMVASKRKERREGLCEAYLIARYGRVDMGLDIISDDAI